MTDPHLWPAITAATLLAGLAATRATDDKAALARALEACHVTDCGQRRCDSCDERLTCTGPEPALTCDGHDLCTDCDQTNRCMWCKDARAAS